MAHGPWLMAHGSWLMAHGSWLMAHGSWLMAHGSWLMAHGSWLMAHGSCSWPLADCYRRPHPVRDFEQEDSFSHSLGSHQIRTAALRFQRRGKSSSRNPARPDLLLEPSRFAACEERAPAREMASEHEGLRSHGKDILG